MQNETFTLQVTADDSLDSDLFDSSFLQRQKFIVGSTSVSKQVRVINGSSNSQTIWTITLNAPKAGSYQIPPVTINGISSNAITLQVEPAALGKTQNQASNTRAQAIEMKTSLTKHEALPGEMLIYKVELLLSTDLARGANLTEPEVNGVKLEQIGKQQSGSKIENGRRISVITLNYAIALSQPGEYQITGPKLEGQMIIKGSGYYARNRLEPVLITGQEQSLKIKPLPTNIPKGVVISPFVSIAENWQPELTAENNITVGEALTRTITLIVANQNEEQLPELSPTYPSSIRHYTDEIDSKQLEKDGILFSQLIHKEAIIATQAGELKLPEVKVPWYNSQTQQLDYAILPARTINVKAAKQAMSDDVLVSSQSSITNAPQQPQSLFLWQGISATLALLCLVTLSLLIRCKKSQPTKAQGISPQDINAFSDRALRQACKTVSSAELSPSSVAIFREHLLRWAQTQWPELSINQLTAMPCYESIKPMLTQLEKACWSDSNKSLSNTLKTGFNSSELFNTLMEYKKQQQCQTETKLNP